MWTRSACIVCLLAALGPIVIAAPAAGQPCGCGCLSNAPPFFAGTAAGPHPVAPNARLFARLDGYDPSSLTLRDGTGASIAFTLVSAHDSAGTAFWVEPTLPLTPGGTYHLTVMHMNGSLFTTELAVEAAERHTAPTLTGIRVAGPSSTGPGLCGEVAGARAAWTTLAGAPLDDLVIEIEVERSGTLIGTTLVHSTPGLDSQETTWFGSGPDAHCLGGAWLPDLVVAENLDARVRAWDQAGNVSAWATVPFQPAELGVASPVPCPAQCSMTGTPSRAGALAWTIGLLLWIRRRAGLTAGSGSRGQIQSTRPRRRGTRSGRCAAGWTRS